MIRLKIAVGLVGKSGDSNVSDSSSDMEECKLFHIRVIIKHTKIDTLLDTGSQAKLISEKVVKQLGL